jgi:hypothetical protein
MTGFDSLAGQFAWVLTLLLAIPAQGQQEQPPVYAGEGIEEGISPGDLQDAETVSYERHFSNPITLLLP